MRFVNMLQFFAFVAIVYNTFLLLQIQFKLPDEPSHNEGKLDPLHNHNTDVPTQSPTNRVEALKHQCLNSDFNPEQSKAVWTMLNDNMAYALGKDFRINTPAT